MINILAIGLLVVCLLVAFMVLWCSRPIKSDEDKSKRRSFGYRNSRRW